MKVITTLTFIFLSYFVNCIHDRKSNSRSNIELEHEGDDKNDKPEQQLIKLQKENYKLNKMIIKQKEITEKLQDKFTQIRTVFECFTF